MNLRQLSCVMALAIAVCTAQLSAQGIQENFDTVAGDPPTTVLNGAGFNQVNDWDSGITGESAFAGTSGNLTGLVEAFGLPAGGVAASGAGAIDFMIDSFNVLDLDFDNVAATGPTEILAGGAGPGTFNFIEGWDANVNGEFAFGGTSAGATLNGSMIEFRSPDADAGATLRRSDCWENASPRVPPRAARRDDKASRFFYLLGTLYGEPKLSVTPNAASWISSCLLSWSSSSWSSS